MWNREQHELGKEVMSTASQSRSRLTRLARRTDKRNREAITELFWAGIVDDAKRAEWYGHSLRWVQHHGSGTTHFLQYFVTDDPKHVEWRSLASIPSSLSLVQGLSADPTLMPVFRLPSDPCMCRLLGITGGSSGDAQSEEESGGGCYTFCPPFEAASEQSGRWTVPVVIRFGGLAEQPEGNEWGKVVECVFARACWERLPFLASAGDWPPIRLEAAETRRLTSLPADEPATAEETGPSPTEVLAGLRNPAIDGRERRTLVIEAEAISFEPGQTEELNSLLRAFIEEHRDSDDPQDIVAVGSAIRKYVATTPFDDMPSIAKLLDAGHKAQVPLGLELEICKMVFRKLAANPRAEKHQLPELESRLTDVLAAYANDRLLSREKYGATAMNAVLALVLLNGDKIPSITGQLRTLKATWFRQLVARQAIKTKDALSRRFHDGKAAISVTNLEKLAGALE